MRNILTLYKRELYSYFASPVAYVVLAAFAFTTGYFFFIALAWFNDQCLPVTHSNPQALEGINAAEYVLRPLSRDALVILLLLMPLVTMRLYSEEFRSGTIEFLLTSPVSYWEIVIAKFAAAMTLYILMLLLYAPQTFILWWYSGMETGPVFTIYIGFLLVGAVFISIGSFASTLTENQIVSAVISFFTCMLFYVFSWFSEITTGKTAELFRYLSITEHYINPSKGVLASRDIVYFLSLIFLGLFLTKLSLESTKWRM